MALGPQALLRPLLDSRGEEGVPLDTSEGPCQRLARGSGPYYLEPPPDELFLDSAAAGSESQALSSEVIRLVVETTYGYIDEVLITNPCQWGRGA